MDEYNDLMERRQKTKDVLCLDDSDFTRLSSKKGLLNKIFHLIESHEKQLETIKGLKYELTKSKNKVQRVENRFNGIQKIDPKTNELIETYETMVAAAKDNGITRQALGLYFSEGREQCAGFKWKLIGKVKKCKHCGKVAEVNKFAKRGQKDGIMHYKNTCLDCYSKGLQ